ncbi:DUF420 domain-containing protein [Taibaiella sp. KBW10]|uniref:DUF420 domain-containing protein n=1 Tax=Taibaiella sp. KBW10 TaxID=2153357 RepID=UPI000F59E2D4|nr:DUF420 domain-containing protein [Taibaiella sp. KBW10]RQO30047.1 DUF420 domain-containing protein [Taibaiella sp. KBW10]
MQPLIKKNDKRARFWIILVSIIIFGAVVLLDSKALKVPYPFSFNVHQFALANAIINSLVSVCLVVALIAIKQRNIKLHKNTILLAIVLSVLFLLSYISHHLWAGDTKYGGTGVIRGIYYFILITHIILAAVILPFILFTAYRGLIAENERHRKIAKYTWPLWFYVSVTGVVVYLMISPYYT